MSDATRPPRRIASVVLVLVMCFAVLGPGCTPTPTATVPALSGLTLTEAAASLQADGFRIGVVTYDAASEGTTWTVVSQSITGEADEGTVVDVVLAGPPPITVPEIVGMPEAYARDRVDASGLVPGQRRFTNHDSVPSSIVLTQTPSAGSLAPAGSVVRLLVSAGPAAPPSASLRLEEVDRITGPYSPKSVVAGNNGYVYAQNMMYRHTVTVFDAESHEEVATVSDAVELADFGITGHPAGTVKGGPVEAAVTPDGAYAYVSNYSMFGPGFDHPGDDPDGPNSGVDPSFVYRIPTETFEIDQVIPVGSVPKYLAVTPDGRYLLVSNWVSYTVSIIDTASGEVVDEVTVGRHPRGIAVSPDSSTAYIAVMGSNDIAVIDLQDFGVDYLEGVGSTPRHLVMSPRGDYLYATFNIPSDIAKIALPSGEVLARVATGEEPRSMAMAPDGESLYVVNYESDTVSKVLTADMTEVQELPTSRHPIGVTYVDDTGEVWVSCYSGAFHVFADR